MFRRALSYLFTYPLVMLASLSAGLLIFVHISAQPARAQSVTSSSSASSAVSSAVGIPVMMTYRSTSLTSRLTREGLLLRLANEPNIKITEFDIDTEQGGLIALRRMLSDNHIKMVLALEPSFDPAFLPIIDSLGITVIATSYLEKEIPASTKGLFSVYPRMIGVREAVERFFIAQPQLKTFSIICSNSRLGIKYSEIWNEIALKRGLVVPRPECGNEQSFDFRVSMIRAKGAGVDGFGVGFGVLNVIARLHEMSWPRPLLLSAVQGEQLLSETLEQKTALPEVFFDSPVFSDPFVRDFSQKYEGRLASASNAIGYEAGTVAIKALALPGDTNAGLRTLNYDGVSGPIDFSVENIGNGAKSVLMHLESGMGVRVH